MLKIKTLLTLVLLLALSLRTSLGAVDFKDQANTPWDQKAGSGPDAVVGGWYINLGITGARAKLTEKNLKCLVIAYIFENTPAYGKLQIGDVIVGANNKPFETPHKNGNGMDKFGGEGPLMDFGNALEESQSKSEVAAASKGAKKPAVKGNGKDVSPGNGQLILDVIRNNEKLVVVLDIGTRYGAYEKSFPISCPKTDLILSELYAYVAKSQNGGGGWDAGGDTNCFAALALLASGDKQYLPNVKRAAEMFARGNTSKVTQKDGLICWHYTFAGIVLSEYYLATGEKWVLPELEKIRDWLMETQFLDPKTQMAGAFKEEAKNDKITQSMLGGWGHNPGYEGYGPISMITGQACMALSLMTRCGIKVNRERHDKAYDFLQRGTSSIGYVEYSGSGGGNSSHWGDMGRTGATSLANFLCVYGDDKYQQRALLTSTCLGTNFKSFPDTHASPVLGMVWQAAAARIHPEGFKNLMSYHKWWFSLAQCADGTFHYQPNRDNSQYGGDSRIKMSAAVAFMFSVKNKNLHITGASTAAQGFKIPEMDLRLDQVTRSTRALYETLSKQNFASGQVTITKLKKQWDDKSSDEKSDKTEIQKELKLLNSFQSYVDTVVTMATEQTQYLVNVGDVYQADKLILQNKRLFSGIENYNKVIDPIAETFKQDEAKLQINAGRAFYEALSKVKDQQTEALTAKNKKAIQDPLDPLNKFIKKFQGQRYAEIAQKIMDELTKYPLASINPNNFFKITEDAKTVK
jgi:Family of unknown function (DUF6288)